MNGTSTITTRTAAVSGDVISAPALSRNANAIRQVRALAANQAAAVLHR